MVRCVEGAYAPILKSPCVRCVTDDVRDLVVLDLDMTRVQSAQTRPEIQLLTVQGLLQATQSYTVHAERVARPLDDKVMSDNRPPRLKKPES